MMAQAIPPAALRILAWVFDEARRSGSREGTVTNAVLGRAAGVGKRWVQMIRRLLGELGWVWFEPLSRGGRDVALKFVLLIDRPVNEIREFFRARGVSWPRKAPEGSAGRSETREALPASSRPAASSASSSTSEQPYEPPAAVSSASSASSPSPTASSRPPETAAASSATGAPWPVAPPIAFASERPPEASSEENKPRVGAWRRAREIWRAIEREQRPHLADPIPSFLSPKKHFDATAQFLVDQIKLVEERGGDADRYLGDVYTRWLREPGAGGVLERKGHPFDCFLQDLRGQTEAWMQRWITRSAAPPKSPESGVTEPPQDERYSRELVARGAAAVAAAAGGQARPRGAP